MHEGEFVHGAATGRGTRRFVGEYQGDFYEGNFDNWQKHGQGKYTWSDGAVHEGNFVNGLPNGQGKRYYAGAF